MAWNRRPALLFQTGHMPRKRPAQLLGIELWIFQNRRVAAGLLFQDGQMPWTVLAPLLIDLLPAGGPMDLLPTALASCQDISIPGMLDNLPTGRMEKWHVAFATSPLPLEGRHPMGRGADTHRSWLGWRPWMCRFAQDERVPGAAIPSVAVAGFGHGARESAHTFTSGCRGRCLSQIMKTIRAGTVSNRAITSYGDSFEQGHQQGAGYDADEDPQSVLGTGGRWCQIAWTLKRSFGPEGAGAEG